MKNLKELTEQELIKAIIKCSREITKLLAVEIENYPGAIMGLGDYYVEKSILIDELITRKNPCHYGDTFGHLCYLRLNHEGIHKYDSK